MHQPTIEIKPEFIGVSAVNPFCAYTSSPRSVMLANHFSQRPSLLTPESRLVKSGIEFELSKYINDVRAEEDCIVRAVIPRYFNTGFNITPSLYIIVEYEKITPLGNKIIFDYIEIPSYNTQHTTFGYNLYPTDLVNNIQIGETIQKDSILATTNSYCNDESYGYGVNANVVFASIPEVSEDGFVVSKSFIEKLKTRIIETRTIYIDKDVIPLNLYGDDMRYKFLPDIGENVREDGLLFATRQRNDWLIVSDSTDASLKEHDPIFDNLCYVKTKSKVIDIKVIKVNTKKNEYNDKITEQLDQYANFLNTFYQTFNNTVNKLIHDKKLMYSSNEHVELSPKLHTLITNILIHLDATSSNSKVKLTYRKFPINQYKVDIVTESYLTPNLGHKLTCTQAGKGVICKILDDEDMPIDEYGNRAEIITDPSSTISRMNLGRVYESYLGATARDNRNRIINYLFNKYKRTDLNYIIGLLSEEDISYIKDYLTNLYSLINPKMETFIKSLSYNDVVKHIEEMLLDKMYIYFPTDNEYNVVDVINNLEQTEYKPYYTKITYKNELKQLITTKENIRIGNMYIMVLEKVADDFMAVSSAKVNNFSFPVKGSNKDKYRYQHSITPTKTLGETEVRIFTSYMPSLANAELSDLNTNPITHQQIVKSILESDKPMKYLQPIDRDKFKYGKGKPLLIFKHICNSYGLNFNFEDKAEGN